MNPLEMMSFGSKLERCGQQHPKVVAFLKENHQEFRQGSVLEIRITTPEGKNVVTNMRMTAEDEEIVDAIKRMKG